MAVSFIASTRGPTSFPGSSNNTSSVACAKPSGTLSGHVMLAFCTSGGGAHHAAPSGWSTVSRYEYVAGNLTTTIFYKVAGGSEGSSYTFTDDTLDTTPMCVEILTYSGCDTTTPVNVHTESSTAGTDTASAPNATSTATGRYIWFRAGKTATVGSEGAFTTGGGTARQRTSNRGNSTQYFVQSVDSSGGDHPPGTLSGASFNSSVTLTASIERTVVLKTLGTPASGTFTSALGQVRASFAATRPMPTGPMVSALPKVSSAFVGTGAPPSGQFDAVLPRPGQALTGNATGGPLAAALPRIYSSLAGSILFGGFAGSLRGITSSVGGAVNPTGPIVSTLPKLTQLSTAETRPHGDNVIVVEDERRAFRIYAEDMVEIFRKAVVIDMTGPNGSMTATLPRPAVMLLGPLGNLGTSEMTLPSVGSAFRCSLEVEAAGAARLPRLDVGLAGVSDSANESALSVTLPPLGGVDFEAYSSVTWVSDGGFVHGTGDLTVPLPASYRINDVLLLAVTADEADTITGPSGWTQVNSSPQATSSATTGNQIAVFWRVSDGSETAPLLTDAGDHLGAIIHAFHGCDIVDGPIDVDGGIFQDVDDTTATMPSLSTTIPDDMVVYVGGHGVSTVSPEAALLSSDADLTNITERSNDSTADGAGGGLYVWTANCPPSTFVDSATFTLADPSVRTGIVVALLPLTTNSGQLTTGGPITSTLPHVTSVFKQGVAAALATTLPHVTSALAGGVIHGFAQFSLPRPVTSIAASLHSPVEGTLAGTLRAAAASSAGTVDNSFKFDDPNYGFDNGVFQ